MVFLYWGIALINILINPQDNEKDQTIYLQIYTKELVRKSIENAFQ